jgi:hypothetical protein
MRIRGGFEALSQIYVVKDICGSGEERRVLLLKSSRLLCVCFGRKNLENKICNCFLCDCSILSVYMVEGK